MLRTAPRYAGEHGEGGENGENGEAGKFAPPTRTACAAGT